MVSWLLFVAVLLGLPSPHGSDPMQLCEEENGVWSNVIPEGISTAAAAWELGRWQRKESVISSNPPPTLCVGKGPCPPCFLKTKWRRWGGSNLLFDFWMVSAECSQTEKNELTSKQFAEEVLKAHNDYRKKHGVPPLKLCKKLNRGAQQYAEELAASRILKHSSESANGKCGENLAWASYDQTGKDVADRWYSEIKNYSFQNPGFSSGTGHFTAMVWKNTKKMGVGKASASDGSTFVVARYDPAGNVVNPGYYEENVLPPRK